jgi:hypothetical protein
MATCRSGKRTGCVMSGGMQRTRQMCPLVPVRNLLTTDYPVTKQLRYVSLSEKQRLNASYPQVDVDLARNNAC